jgi:hypothetical protein
MNIAEEAGGLYIIAFLNLTILKRVWSANSKMLSYFLLRPLRPELDGQAQMQIIVTRALNCSHYLTD